MRIYISNAVCGPEIVVNQILKATEDSEIWNSSRLSSF
jgi:hypothetical protein